MVFLVALVVDGALAGAVYALVALAFVVYKASRMINFALGESLMLASRLVASGLQALGSGSSGRSASGAPAWWRRRWSSTGWCCAGWSAGH